MMLYVYSYVYLAKKKKKGNKYIEMLTIIIAELWKKCIFFFSFLLFSHVSIFYSN